MALFEDLHNAGNTIILVTHEEDIAEHAHRIVRIFDGRVAHDEINKTPRKALRPSAPAEQAEMAVADLV